MGTHMQAGWYDDGSGRQRWWDGERWTEHFAPEPADAPVLVAPAPASAMDPAATTVAATGTAAAPVLGYIGLGLAVLGTVLACIPAVFVIGGVVLLAGFVVSLIGLFKAGAAKWPSIVGMVLSVIGGILGTVILVVPLLAGVVSQGLPSIPSLAPESTSSAPPADDTDAEDPAAEDTASTGNRLSPEEVADGFAAQLRSSGLTGYDRLPDFYPCLGQSMYDSALSDESLRLLVDAEDPLDEERDAAFAAIEDAIHTCDPNGEGNGA